MNFLQIKLFKIITICFFLVLVLASTIGFLNLESSSANFILGEQLKESIFNTILMGLGVIFLASIISIFFAYYNVFYEYKFKRLIHIIVILPLCIPVYIFAYNYSVMLTYGGVFDFLNLNYRNIYGAIVIYSLCLYPYIYLILVSTMKKIPFTLIESAKFYHKNFFVIFVKIIFPIILKSLIVGNILVLSEVFSDIGVVMYFNINSLALLIRKLYNATYYSDALKIGYSFAFVVLALFILEQYIYKNLKFSNTKDKKIVPLTLNNRNKFIFHFGFFTVSTVAFFIPTIQMIFWASKNIKLFKAKEFFIALFNTTSLVIVSLIIIIVLSLVVSHTMKYTAKLRFLALFFNVGYIIPSMIISLVIVVLFAFVNDKFSTNFIIASSVIPLVCAYVVKYISLALNNIWKNYELIHPNISASSLILSKSKLKTFFSIDLPLCKNAIITGSLIIIIDIYKELTLTYTLRPFNFETLATRVALYAKDEMIQESAIHSLTIVSICLVCVILLERLGGRKK